MAPAVKKQFFLYLALFYALLRVLLTEFYKAIWVPKTRMTGLPDG